jgi:O-antigen ligase
MQAYSDTTASHVMIYDPKSAFRSNYLHKTMEAAAFALGISQASWFIISYNDWETGKFLYALLLLALVFYIALLKPFATLKIIIRQCCTSPIPGLIGIVFLLFALSSTFWTLNESYKQFNLQLIHWILDFIALFFVIAVIGGRQAFMQWKKGLIVGAFVILFYVVTIQVSSGGIVERLGDESITPNTLARIIAIPALLLFNQFLISKTWQNGLKSYLLTALLLIGLLITISKTSFIGFFGVGALMMSITLYTQNLRLMTQGGFTKLSIILLSVILAGATFLIKTKDYEDFSNFTGRTSIWERAIDYIQKAPLAGRGLGSVVTVSKGSRLLGIPNITQLHNQTVHTIFEYGIIGLLIEWLMYASFVLLLVNAYKRRKKEGSLQGSEHTLLLLNTTAIFTFSMFNGLMEASSMLIFSPFLCLLTSSALQDSKRYEQAKIA